VKRLLSKGNRVNIPEPGNVDAFMATWQRERLGTPTEGPGRVFFSVNRRLPGIGLPEIWVVALAKAVTSGGFRCAARRGTLKTQGDDVRIRTRSYPYPHQVSKVSSL
jgi:hypothetical protein